MRSLSYFRDAEQLKAAPSWAMSAIDGLLRAEESLAAALRYVPYCREHGSVWSPEFGRIVLECASQVDSVWTATATLGKKKPKIKDHYASHAPRVQKQQVVLFSGNEPTLLAPFADWTAATPPQWWTDYNKLKHDRFAYQKLATLDNAISSLGSLLLAITYSGDCDLALVMSKLLDSGDRNPWAYTNTGLLRDVVFDCQATVETRLFAHPLGVFENPGGQFSTNWPNSSARFTRWWTLNHQQFRPTPP